MEAAGLRPAEINMGITEIVLLLIGVAAFAASFFIPEKYSAQDERDYKEIRDKLKTFLKQELQLAQISLEEKTDEVIVATTEKAERYMERITNEKMMAVQEYSDTVLEQIHKNHEEAVFLYDMLNNKHDQIKITAIDINNKIEEAKKDINAVAGEVINELAGKAVQENLEEQAREMIHSMVQESVREMTSNLIIPAVPGSYSAPPLVSMPTVSATVELTAEEKSQISGITKSDNFRQLSLEIPEVVMEEEQPLLVHPIKKVSPKKKTPAKKPPMPSRPINDIVPETNRSFEPQPEERSGGAGGNKERILQLHQEGKSEIDIAKELGLGIGEVKLIIGLYK